MRQPGSISIYKINNSDLITRRWCNPFAYGLSAITLVLGGFCVALVSITSDLPLSDPLQLFPVVFSVVAAVMGYIALVRLINRTTIRITVDTIEVLHGPLPWRRGFTIMRRDIDCFVIKKSTTTYDATTATFYNVYAHVRNSNDDICLLQGDIAQNEANCVIDALGSITGIKVHSEAKPLE